MNGVRLRYLSFYLCVLFAISGCASWGTYNPATGRNEMVFISTKEEISMGRDLHRSLEKEYEFSRSQADIDRLQDVGSRVAQISDRQDYTYNFYLIEKDELNAFTTLGGNIYFYTGLMKKVTSDDELAAILAHEIGHCAAKHVAKKMQGALGYNLLGNIILSQFERESRARQVASQSSSVVMNLVFSAYSRRDEYEADKIGVRYLERAGYDPQAMVSVLEMLQRESKGKPTLLYLRTHPYVSDRIKRIKQQINQE